MKTWKIHQKTVLAAMAFLFIALAIMYHELLAQLVGLGLGALKGGLLLGITNTPAGASQAPNTAANGFNTTNCDPRMIAVDDAMSLTRANITGWNKSDIESNMFKEVGLDKIIAQTKEARLAGSRMRTLTDLLMSRMVPLKMGAAGPQQSIIQPFTLRPRRNRINPGYFRVYTGVALANFTAQGGSAGSNVTFAGISNGTITLNAAVTACWVLTVNNGSLDADSSPFQKSPNNVLKNIEKYFLPRHSLTSEFVDTATGVKYTTQLRVVDSAAGPTNDQAYVLVIPNRTFKGDSTLPGGTLIPNGNTPAQVTGAFGQLSIATNGWFESASSGDKKGYQPTTGIVSVGANAVSDYQSYGNQLPGYNDYGLVEYWPQTHRWVHKFNDEYKRALAAMNTSEGLRKFRLLPLAKLRAQQEKMNDDSFYNSVFFGDAENENQTTTLWDKLPQVQDPAWNQSGETGTLAIEYISRTIGIRTQINACGNVLDMQGGALDVDALLEAGYWVKREREGETDAEVTEIDIFTDGLFTRPMLRQLFVKYFKAKYSVDSVQMWIKPDQAIYDPIGKGVLFEYDTYSITDYGYKLNVFSNSFFDDKVSNFQNGQKSAGRSIWMIDWSDVAIGIMKSMSVPRTNNLADNIYKYIIQQNVQHVLLNSRKFQVEVGNTNRHRIIENYGDACGKLTVQGCDLTVSN